MSDDPFKVLRRMAGDPVPTDVDRQRAWARLEDAIATDRQHPRRRWLVPVAVAAALLVAVASVVVVSRPSRVEAALGEIAYAARLATPQKVPEESFLYTRIEEVALVTTQQGDLLGLSGPVGYLLPVTRQEWGRGAFQQLVVTTGAPIFFDPKVEAAYYAHGWDKSDHVGQTVTLHLTGVTHELADIDWPTDPHQLRDALEAYVKQRAVNWPIDIEVFKLATDLLREAEPGPGVRTALIDVFAQLPVTLVDQTPDGSVTLAVTYNRPPNVRDTITLDAQGHLIAETSTLLEPEAEYKIPAGTRVGDATSTVPTTVNNLDIPEP